MPGETVANRLARWVVGLRYEDLPLEVVSHAKHCMLDTLGVQIRGATLPWVQPVYKYVRSLGGNREATITYHGDRLIAPYAAYANSAFSYSCELQHHGSFRSAHPGVIVIPTIQALGEKLGSTGQEVITAMVAGYEVQGRLGLVLFESAFRRHFHPQGLLGVFSSAAAAGKLLGLNEKQQTHAFAIAGSHASSILEYDQAGGEVKRIHGAIALRNGIQSALLAKEGLTGPLTVFEGHHGIFASFAGGEADPEQVFSGIARPYCVTQCTFRIYPTIGSCHATLDILNNLLTRHSFDYRDVESIRVGMPGYSVSHVGTITRPHDVISAQASLGYSIGVRMVKGSNDLEMYIHPDLWRNPEILSVADKIQTYPIKEESMPNMTRVEISLRDSRHLEGEQEDTLGSPKMPFPEGVIEDKFRRLAGAVLPRDRVEQVMETVAHLEKLPSVSRLVPSLLKG